MEISNKKISVIGAVRSGLGAAKLVKQLGGIPFVSDAGDNDKVKKSLAALAKLGIEGELGGHTERVFDCQIMVVSPGVPLNSAVILKAKELGIELISELELAFNFCKGKIAAVTGTNGKTTTTALLGHLFDAAGVKSFTAGNIGTAFSELVLDVNENDLVALEVSSYQLDLIKNFKPAAALILNITPDHLNRYDNKLENYIASKQRVYENQTETDFLVLNADDSTVTNNVKQHSSKDFYFSLSEIQKNGCYLNNGNIVFSLNGKNEFEFPVSGLNIKGEHNIANAMAAIIVCKNFGISNDKITAGLKSFNGVEHRLELVREIEGVKYINDSKATNVESVWYALRSFEQKIFLILGGEETGNDYNKIKELVEAKVKKVFAIGSSAEKVFNFFHTTVKVEMKSSLQEAVFAANLEAREDDIVLLSPACKSFDMFDSYEHRGKVFKETVNNL